MEIDSTPDSSEELFFRQIHSSWVTSEGTVSMQAFRPSKKDARKLSVTCSGKFDAQSAYQKHLSQSLSSVGSMAINNAEVIDAYTALETREDGVVPQVKNVVVDNDPFEGHAHVDFTDLTKRECKSVAANLVSSSSIRGWLFQP